MNYRSSRQPLATSLWLILTALSPLFIAGCANPAPPPPPPPVAGIDAYLAGSRAKAAGDDARARILIERAVDQDPDLVSARQMLGDLDWKSGDYADAAEQYEAFARLDPYNFKTHYDVALAYQFLSRLQEAVAAYLDALKLAPRDLDSNMNLGVVYLSLGKTSDAVRQLEFAVSVDPKSAPAQCNLGAAFETDGQLGRAEAAYERAIELDPQMTVAMMDLASLLIRENRPAEAVPVLQAAAKIAGTAAVHKKLGDAWYLQHQDAQALAEYDAALRIDGGYWPAMNQLGLLRLRQYQAGLTLNENLRRSAVAFWRESLGLNPNQPVVRQWVQKWDQNGRVAP